jgi:diaminopimelate epimerase
VRVADVDSAPVATAGPAIEAHARFARRSMPASCRCVDRCDVRLRVHERGAGETLACGTGACAAVVAGIRLGWLDAAVEVHTRGGDSRSNGPVARCASHVLMTGPAETVFEGEIEL